MARPPVLENLCRDFQGAALCAIGTRRIVASEERSQKNLDSAYWLRKHQRFFRFLQVGALRSLAPGSLKQTQRGGAVTAFQRCLGAEEKGVVFVDAAMPADSLSVRRRRGLCHDAKQSEGQASGRKNSQQTNGQLHKEICYASHVPPFTPMESRVMRGTGRRFAQKLSD